MIKRDDLLSVDVTLQCNLMCRGCNKFVSPQGHGYMMEMVEYTAIMDLIIPECNATYIRLIGGEPLLNSNIVKMSDMAGGLGLEVELATNGILLESFDQGWLQSLFSIKITDYGYRNRIAVNKYRSWPNVTIINSMDVWRDPSEDKKISLSESDGKIAYHRCPMGTIKVCDGKIWDCCAAESLERVYDIPKNHVALRPGWKEALNAKSLATTCQRCHFAASTITHLKEIGEYEMERSRV